MTYRILAALCLAAATVAARVTDAPSRGWQATLVGLMSLNALITAVLGWRARPRRPRQ
jgi:hypothetical protein